MSRTGDWIVVHPSNKKFFVTDPDPADVEIEDIAHSLSIINRFGGHICEPYCVAQHVCHVHDEIRKAYPHNFYLQRLGLLHDAPESYVGDMVRPFKQAMPDYIKYEERVMGVILQALDLRPPTAEEHKIIKKYDNILLMTERRDLRVSEEYDWTKWTDEKPRAEKITPWYWSDAKYQFLLRYYLTSSYEKEHRQKAA
jgi:hypothetical protein